MASTGLNTFTLFADLPVELQMMIWEEAAAGLPALDIQRFTAEIISGKQNDDPRIPAIPTLCLTPHPDFIRSTIGYRGLFGACQLSRKFAKRLIPSFLPIRYLKRASDGSLVTLQAMVPFNPSGHFCIGRVVRAVMDADKYGIGARGSKMVGPHDMKDIRIPAETASRIKNLMLATDRKPILWGSHVLRAEGEVWWDEGFQSIGRQLPNLERASLLGEGILDRRHHFEKSDFDRLHQSVAVVPRHQRDPTNEIVPWIVLWNGWFRQQILLYALMGAEIERIEQHQLRNSNESGSVDGAAMAARKRTLELNSRALVPTLTLWD
ncbi:hypothetical protein DHEL01_v200600 [Diaporthe helianthi]|uniref:2EXR domain-containing protein n=1 Tax=Diaporthe helianthi TaxID=158607 RepID=A0A2P5IEW6_DIAHE|nr:hypothetical protein DHEL01_v200600 [Diaporthe helianthi]